jgi:hypothetical protein
MKGWTALSARSLARIAGMVRAALEFLRDKDFPPAWPQPFSSNALE